MFWIVLIMLGFSLGYIFLFIYLFEHKMKVFIWFMVAHAAAYIILPIMVSSAHAAELTFNPPMCRTDPLSPGVAENATTDYDREFRISGRIVEPSFYKGILNYLYLAKQGEHILIRIDSMGGEASARKALVKAIQDSKATVISYVEGKAFSAAANIAYAADIVKLGPKAELMFHLGHVRASGPLELVLQALMNQKTRSMKYLTECCSIREGKHSLLTDKDLEDIASGKDVYK